MIPFSPGMSIRPKKPCRQKHCIPEQVTPQVQLLERMAGFVDYRSFLLPTLSCFFYLVLFQGVRSGGQIRHGATADVMFFDLRADALALEVVPFRSAFVPTHGIPRVVSPQFFPGEYAGLASRQEKPHLPR